MSRVLFVNGNLHGHFNPTLPVVTELVKRGEEVWYFCSNIFEEKIKEAGAHFIDSGEELEKFYQNYQPSGNHPFFTLLEYLVKYDEVMVPVLLEKVKALSFDYVIYDSILGGGFFLRELMKVSVFCSNSSFAMDKLPIPEHMQVEGFHPQLDEFYKSLQRICREWKINIPSIQEFFIGKGDLNIIYTARSFNPGGENFDESYVFVGPSIREKEELEELLLVKLKDKKVIYISLGTINTEFQSFYQMCISTFGNTEYEVVMSVGKKCDINSFGKLPDNIIVANYVPQLEVLKRTSIFISHGGLNSISEALSCGVPVIAIPLANDQFMSAGQLVKLGAGISLKMNELTENVLKESVTNVLSDHHYFEACAKLRNEFYKAGGAKKAVDAIFDFK